MAGQEFLRGQPTSAFELQIENPQRSTATRNDDTGLVGLQNFAGLS